MLKDEGNDKFSEGEYQDALDEYEYALNLFDYEMANLLRDQVRVAAAISVMHCSIIALDIRMVFRDRVMLMKA